MPAVRIYKAQGGYYIGVNPLEIGVLLQGTAFTIIRRPDTNSHIEQERHWRRSADAW